MAMAMAMAIANCEVARYQSMYKMPRDGGGTKIII